jgi:hypothetical protein
MTSVALYAYLPSDFGTSLPPDPHLAAQTGRSLSVRVSREAVPVALRIEGGRLALPISRGGFRGEAGDGVVPIWTLVDAARNIRFTAYEVKAAGGPFTLIAVLLPLRPGQGYTLSMPVTKDGIEIRFRGGLAKGTRILTAQGKFPVERLEPGSLLWTGGEDFAPVLRVEVQTVTARGIAAPVRLQRGFLGLSDDLLVSGNHGVRVEVQGAPVLVPASAFVALGMAAFEFGQKITWYEVVLASHALILAQGLLCETCPPSEPEDGRERAATKAGGGALILPRLTEAEAVARLK